MRCLMYVVGEEGRAGVKAIAKLPRPHCKQNFAQPAAKGEGPNIRLHNYLVVNLIPRFQPERAVPRWPLGPKAALLAQPYHTSTAPPFATSLLRCFLFAVPIFPSQTLSQAPASSFSLLRCYSLRAPLHVHITSYSTYICSHTLGAHSWVSVYPLIPFKSRVGRYIAMSRRSLWQLRGSRPSDHLECPDSTPCATPLGEGSKSSASRARGRHNW